MYYRYIAQNIKIIANSDNHKRIGRKFPGITDFFLESRGTVDKIPVQKKQQFRHLRFKKEVNSTTWL